MKRLTVARVVKGCMKSCTLNQLKRLRVATIVAILPKIKKSLNLVRDYRKLYATLATVQLLSYKQLLIYIKLLI